MSQPSADSGDVEPRFDPDRIVETLARHGVEYLMVGGLAARLHGASRTTEDLDCLPQPDDDNLERLAAALRELGARLRAEGLSDEQSKQLTSHLPSPEFFRRSRISNWVTDAGLVDVLTDLPDRGGQRVDYAQLVGRSSPAVHSGITVRLAHLDDIVASKEFANRPKDHEALPELRQLQGNPTSGDQPSGPQSRRTLANGLDLPSPAKRPPERGVDR